MQPANQISNQITEQVQIGTHDNKVHTDGELDDFARKQINKVFERLQAIFPTWRNAYPTDEELNAAKRNWTLAFVASGIHSIDQIKQGMNKARTQDTPFFPTSGQFIAWCTYFEPNQIGMPSVDEAYREAIRNCHNLVDWKPTHPAVYEAGRKVTWHRLRRSDTQSGEREYRREYMKLCYEAQKTGKSIQSAQHRITDKSGHIPKRKESEIVELKQYGRSRMPELKALLRR